MNDLNLKIETLNNFLKEIEKTNDESADIAFKQITDYLNESFPDIKEFYYVLKYIDQNTFFLGKFKETIIINLKLIIKALNSDNLNNKEVVLIKRELIKLLDDSEILSTEYSENINEVAFEMWKSDIGDFLNKYKFKIDVFEKNFLAASRDKYKFNREYFLLEEIRQIILDIIFALNEYGLKIINDVNIKKELEVLNKNGISSNNKVKGNCSVRNQNCSYIFDNLNICFIACPANDEISLELEIIKGKLKDIGLKPYIAVKERAYNKDIFCVKICSKIIESKFCIVILNDVITGKKNIRKPNPNVYYEYGIMTALNKYIIPVQDENHKLAFNIQSLDIMKYKKSNFSELIETAIYKAKDDLKII